MKEDRLAKKKMNLTAPASDMKKTPENELSASLGTADNKLNTKKPPSAVSRQKETAPSLKKHLPAKPGLDDREASKKSVAAKSVPSGKPATGAKKPKKIETYDRLKDSKLKLQALAWFVDAPKRIAVINDRIVREGESVDGYQVTEIRPQDVVVNDGTKSWSLEFGLKQ